MTYTAGGNIRATDYNNFATLAGGINEIFSDLYSGSTTLPQASYGYGQQPALTPVSAGSAITATQWASLFSYMKNCGTHQGTTTVPPLPSTNPLTGDTVTTYSSLTTLLGTLKTNRYNLAAGQSTMTVGTQYSGSGSWTSTLKYTFQVNLGSWDNARYFFNSGGFLGINGAYSSPSTPGEIAWSNALNTMTILKFRAETTTPGSGSGGTSIGFYGLTASYQTIYESFIGGSYGTSYVRVRAKLSSSAGTNGLIDFEVNMVDNDTTPDIKSASVSFWCDNTRATGVVTYPGTITIGAGSFSYT